MKKRTAMGLIALLVAALTFGGCAAGSSGDLSGDTIDAPDLPPNATMVPVTTPAPTEDPLADVPTPDGIPDVHDEGQTEKLSYERDYETYAKQNSDVVGWISVPNTIIEYPVVITTDNDYYLHYNYKKEKSKSGAIFMDYRNADFENSRHVIIYGHNMRNGTMFHELNSYKNKDFFKQNPVITLYYKGKKYEYEIFSANVVLADINFIRTKFKSDDDFVDYFAEFKSYSKFENDVTVGPNDQVLTLSTCTYEYDDSRFIVQARRVMD